MTPPDPLSQESLKHESLINNQATKQKTNQGSHKYGFRLRRAGSNAKAKAKPKGGAIQKAPLRPMVMWERSHPA